MKAKIRNWIKNWLNLYELKDLTIGGHCGCCGAWIPNEILVKFWAWGICKDCLKIK